MINLKFYIKSYNYEQSDYEEFYVSNYYSKALKFNTILTDIYKYYDKTNLKITNYYIPNINNLFFGQFFSIDIIRNIKTSIKDYEELSLAELENQFGISKIEIPIILNPIPMGAASGEVEGIKFFFHTNEKDLHHIPHIHCKYADVETRIDIINLTVLDKPFKNKKMKIALDLVRKNQNGLLKYWNNVVVKGESMKFTMDI